MRRPRRLLALAACLTLGAIILPTTFASAAGPADNTVRLAMANGSGTVTYQDANGTVATQSFTATNKCVPNPAPSAYIGFLQPEPANGGVGFSSGSLGVKTPGEGSSGKCEQVNVPDQKLKLKIGSALTGKTFDFAELDIEAKFNAAINIRLFNGSTPVDASPGVDGNDLVISCTSSGSDCGPDSADRDNFRVRVPSSGTQPFTEMWLWATGTSTSGAVSLEGGADGTLPLEGGLGASIVTTDSIFHLTPGTTLSVTKTAANASVSVGETVGYTVTVTNNGSNPAFGVTASDTLPTGAGVGSWTIGSQTGTACQIASGVVGCTIGTLAANGSYSFSVSATTSAVGTLSNTASASASNASTQTASASISVLAPGVTVTKVADDGNDDDSTTSTEEDVTAGDPIGYTITVSNAAGAGTASGVTLSDPLPTPAGTSWSIESQSAGGGCTIVSDELGCGPVTLTAGSSFSVHITSPTTADTASQDAIENTASVTWTGGSAAATASASVGVWSGMIGCTPDNPDTEEIETDHNQASATDEDLADITVTRHANTDGGVCTAKNYVIDTALEPVTDIEDDVNVVTFLEDLDTGQSAHYTMQIHWTYERRSPVDDPANPATVGGRTFYIDYDGGTDDYEPAKLCDDVTRDTGGAVTSATHPTDTPWCITGQTYTIDESGLVDLFQDWDGFGDPRSY